MTCFRKTVSIFFAPLLMVAAMSVPSGAAESLAGSFLAANQANYDNDYDAASLYFARALAGDPENTSLMQNLLLADIGKGDVENALVIGQQMEALGAKNQIAQLVILTDLIRQGDFAGADATFAAGQNFSPLLDGLVHGWVMLGLGRMSQATSMFEKTAKTDAMRSIADYHHALALAVVGDFEGAVKLIEGRNGRPLRLGRLSLIAHIEILSQLERNDDALKIAVAALGDTGDPETTDIVRRLNNGETLPFDVIKDAREGASEVFSTLAAVLANDANDRFGLIYGRLAEFLRPRSAEAILQVADMLSAQEQYELAIRDYNKVPGTDPLFYSAEIGRAGALQSAGKTDAAIEVLRGLSKTHKTIPTVFTSLGDALRRESRFVDATDAYNAAVRLLPDPKASHWFLYYARGMTYERVGEWDKSVADFRFALKLSPDQPLVLNYLGYGLVERREKLEEAQKMIETAVAKRPNDGYITDSLGWVFYRVGKFEEAVAPLERAVELLSVDPVVNDHLGDAYWMVGRKLEAKFQWRRALSFGPEDKDAVRIRTKLDVGLDEVLKTESEAPKSK